jgi:hypothetical protein
VEPRRSIRGEAHCRLVAERVEGQDRALLRHLEESEGKIPGDAEDLPGPIGTQSLEHGLGELHQRTSCPRHKKTNAHADPPKQANAPNQDRAAPGNGP